MRSEKFAEEQDNREREHCAVRVHDVRRRSSRSTSGRIVMVMVIMVVAAAAVRSRHVSVVGAHVIHCPRIRAHEDVDGRVILTAAHERKHHCTPIPFRHVSVTRLPAPPPPGHVIEADSLTAQERENHRFVFCLGIHSARTEANFKRTYNDFPLFFPQWNIIRLT